jgi:ABC-type anion transport system duplicated permease subunit
VRDNSHSRAYIPLPYYAGRSTLRMFIALGFSLLFTLACGYIAAKSRRAERLLIPLLDILQSARRLTAARREIKK